MSANEIRHRHPAANSRSIARSLQLAVMQAPGVSIQRAAERARAEVEVAAAPLRATGVSYAAWAQAAA